MEINTLKLTLAINKNLQRKDAEKIRGYFSNIFWDNPYAHGHQEDGSFIYRYPCVQYKVIEGSCLLIGFSEGQEIIKNTFNDLKGMLIGDEWEEVLSKCLESYSVNFSVSEKIHQHVFFTPWLALNKDNYEKYQRFGRWSEKKALLEKILTGNIISMSKGIGYTVADPVMVNIVKMRKVTTVLKGVPMLGFLGSFTVNFNIPDYWGIGKSVSRGFGTVKKAG